MTLSMDLIRDLAVRRPGTPVLSVYVRTDPRDPANTATPPGWLVELRNGLREVSRTVEEADARGQRLALRDLRERVEREIVALRPAERGRGLAWFVTADAALDQRFTLQLPPHGTLVRWDDYPFVSPLADVADRGLAGIVLASAEAIRLLHWQDGRVAEPARSLYEIQRGEWRDYDAYVGHPGRSPAGMHVAEFDQRLDEWRRRFLRSTAEAVARQLTGLGWDRILLAGERRVTDAFLEQLPEPVPGRVVAVVEANLIWEEHTAVADRLEGTLDEARSAEARALVEKALGGALAGGAAAIGWPEVIGSLVNHRVSHLIVGADATPDPALLGPRTQAALGLAVPPDAGRARSEPAVISGAEITVLPADTAELARAGGAAAFLRY